MVMPTWRRALLGETIGSGNRRKSLSHFADSPFAQAWTGLINDEALHAELGRLELRLAFMPHPNMRPYLDQLRVHPDVTLLDYARDDVQEVLCSAAVVVTDYSSMAFEAAFLQRPVVYYQFDRDEFFAGGHAYRKGQWDYELNGFGPVTTDHDQARDALLDAIRRQGRPAEPYARRMVEAFPLRDGGNCERVVGTIRALNSPLTYAEAYRPARSTS